jgi:hypothetical protein
MLVLPILRQAVACHHRAADNVERVFQVSGMAGYGLVRSIN